MRLATIVLVVLLAALCASCGARTHTYSDDRTGFSVTVDKRFVEQPDSKVGDNAVARFVLVDEDGARVDDRYLDAIAVVVVDIGTPLTSDDLEALRATLRDQGELIVSTLGTSVQTWEPADVTVSGLQGIRLPFAMTVGDRRVVGENYVLFRDAYVYLLVVMGAEEDWEADRALYQQAIDSFTVTGAAPWTGAPPSSAPSLIPTTTVPATPGDTSAPVPATPTSTPTATPSSPAIVE